MAVALRPSIQRTVRRSLTRTLLPTLALCVWPVVAAAQAWTWQPAGALRLELDDNPGLAATAGRTVATVRTEAGVVVTRASEHSEWRQDVELGWRPRLDGQSAATEGRVALDGRVRAERRTLGLNLEWRRDDTEAAPADAGGLLLGRARRDAATAALSLAHRMDERTGLSAALSGGQTRFGGTASAAQDFDQWGFSTGLSWRADERTMLETGLGGSAQRAASSAADLTTLRASIEHAWSEWITLDASVTASWLRRRSERAGLVCPLPVAFCQAGIVRPVAVLVESVQDSRPLQYSLSLEAQVDPRRTLSVATTQALTLGGLGVSRDESFALRGRHRLDERGSLGLAIERSKATVRQEAGDAAATLERIRLDGEQRLSPEWTLRAEIEARRSERGGGAADPRSGARSARIAISLQYNGPIIALDR